MLGLKQLDTKPYAAKSNGRNWQSALPAAVCAIVQSKEGGEVAAEPGFEEMLAKEIAKREETFPGTWTNLGDGRWSFSQDEQ